jgi:type I restriction enzyme M protein
LRKRLLFKVTQAFSEAPLDPDTVDNHAMGTIFEYLIRKFKEASNEAAGQFYTPRDIIRLMVKQMFEPDRNKLAKMKLLGIYDPACGTGGMLTIAKEYLLAAVNPELDIQVFGQEINEKTYAIAKADVGEGRGPGEHQAGKHAQSRPAPRLAIQLHAFQSPLRQGLEEYPRRD